MEARLVYSFPTKSKSLYTINEINRNVGKSDSHMGVHSWLLKTLAAALLLLTAMTLSISQCLAQTNDNSIISLWTTDWDFNQTYVYSSLYTKHHDPDPNHVNNQNMIGFEGQTRDKRVMGLAIFDNSFGQKSEYLYVGKKWRRFGSDHWYFKLTGGLLHGYVEPYEDNIPLNGLGVAPAIVPTLGYQGKTLVVEFNQLGLAASLITVGFTF
jgi:hypothetical protein